MKKRLVIILLVFLFVLSSCAARAVEQSVPMEAPAADYGGERAVMEESAVEYEYDTASEAPGAPNAADERIVIRNASLTIIVEDPADAMDGISQMTDSMGGFVVSSSLYKTYAGSGIEVPAASLTVRVPAQKLTEALAQIKGLVEDPENDIRSENISGQDVTKEYTDLNSRLRNLEDTESRLREFMGSATKMEDVLAINSQLTQTREEIEVLKGQIQYYEEAAALSSISIDIQAQASVQPVEIGGWKPVGIARDAVQALIDTLQFLGSVAIWLIIFIVPVGLIIILPLRFLWWLIRRNKKNRKPQNPIPPVTPPTTPPNVN